MLSCHRNCKHFGVCGGCSSPQTEYEISLREKELALHHIFEPLIPSQKILPVIPCSPLLRGRNKMEFSFYQTADGEKTLGFISPSKPKKGIPITECLMIDERAMDILNYTRVWWSAHPELSAYYPPLNKGSLCTLTIRVGNVSNDFMIILTTSGREEFAVSQDVIQEWQRGLLNLGLPITSIFWEERISARNSPTTFRSSHLYGEPFLKQQLSLEGRSNLFHIRPRSFFQPQSRQAEKIILTIKDFISPTGKETLLDLYCGAGTIGILLSPYVKKVIGVELVPDAIASAHENIQLNSVNMEVFLEDAKRFCKRNEQAPAPDAIIVDPPRCGMQNKALKYLLRIAPKKIVYVSCNPLTQIHECTTLVEQGYKLQRMQPIDQFPHTHHLENVVLLEKLS
ncbi:23S rRNA (uracil(1939)-C(5))-methyltransferase RlmD [Chlamydia suis]|uniref:23S rRNA (uracil(1939)-C(5))-methyltransferase RlmD n=1 Tax=Chlamydia suis TaxID=83559 RepID=UPI0009E5EA18|nr:23S rRNA (uracil(1939)-C(5))-methyltransferase RlmD [Chlamydia suis]